MDPTPLVIFLILLLLLVLGVGMVFLRMASRQARFRVDYTPWADGTVDFCSAPSWRVCRSMLFKHPCRWLAIRCLNPPAVRDALDLQDATLCGWVEGLTRLGDDHLFITPPLNGWVLVFGSALPAPEDDIDRVFHFLQNLSRQLGEVQYFAANRVVDHHAWARMVDGRVRRAYAWTGETVWNDGEKTDAERRLSLRCLHYGETRQTLFGSNDRPNADRIFALAARWSLDPTTIEPVTERHSQGILGSLSDPRRAQH
ncbi:MAG TPA: hypothetical protein VHH73_20535 [Verrucomicrobiae bacterium]|nr:hypothetical protein [Verrucomicrobiae bacterium]